MEDFVKIFNNFLQKKNLKNTRSRQIILKEVFLHHGHFDAEELYDKLQKKRHNISRATVYRTLPILVESGLIQKSLRCLEKDYYEHIYGHPHHDHLICIKCGKIIEFTDQRIERLQEDVCKKYNFKSMEHRLGIRGLCSKCNEGKKEKI